MALTKDKNELLGKLYSLRAGLSLVSQEKQIVDEIFQKAETTKNLEIRHAGAEADSAYNKLKRAESSIISIQNDIDKTKADLDTAKNTLSSNETNFRRSKTMIKEYSIILGVILCIMIALTISILAVDFLPNYAAIVIWLFPIIPLNPVGIGTWVVSFLLIKAVKKYKNDKWYYKCSISKPENLLKDLSTKETQLEITKSQYKNANIHYEEAKKTEAEQKKIIYENYIKDRAEADPHLFTAKATIDSLNEEYGDFLDPRDWENLDLIIFSIETQRADSLKDALNIVDSEKRADRITDAIHLANKEICESISAASTKMQNSLEAGFTGLSRQITEQAQVLSKQIRRVGSMVSAQSEYLQKTTTVLALSTALQANAYKSSQELAKDVKRIKDDTKYLKDKN